MTMPEFDWKQLTDLFNEALDRPAAERAAFLDAACDGVPGLRLEVEDLLRAHSEAEELGAIGSPFVGAVTSNGAGQEDVDESDQQVGSYRLIRLLGRGGMGSVYLAERADGQFEQVVALKVMRRGMDTDDILARFAFERQILAGLDHPNIARLHDGGASDDGRPFFAMEYVKGVPITAYCDEKRLTTKDRLHLFRTVCQAVQHAHKNLIVHRDLKPSNILVTDEGTVKLLDFGIAKLLAEEDTEDPSMPLTRTGVRMLTPEYAAPEQLTGDPITTATDVYQLGAVLYELLTGRRPYRITTRVEHEIVKAILESEPERPSTAVGRTVALDADGDTVVTPANVSRSRSTDPARLKRGLSGDLDSICLAALRKEPERRYSGADALGDDIRRHIEGLPVTAQPDSLKYRMSRFVARHRVGVAATTAVFLALIIGLGGAIWQSRVAADQRDRAESALAQSNATLDYLRGAILSGGPYEGDPNATIGAVLDTAASRVDEDLSDAPIVAASVHLTLAKVYLERGLPTEAAHHARRARELESFGRGVSYAEATTQLGTALSDGQQYDEAIPYHEEAVAILRPVEDARNELANALNAYAATLSYMGRDEEAEVVFNEAISIFRELGDAEELLPPLNNLAVMFSEQGRYDEAAASLKEVIATLDEAGGTSYMRATAMINLAGTLNYAGELDEALDLYIEGSRVLAEELGTDHPEAIMAQVSLGNHYFALGDLAGAQQESAVGLEWADQSLGPDHFITAYAQSVAGRAYCDGSDAATGAPLLRASLETRRGMIPEGHWLLANGESLLGDCLAKLGRNAEAETLLTSGFETLKSDRGPDHVKTEEARQRLRSFYESAGRTDEAAALD